MDENRMIDINIDIDELIINEFVGDVKEALVRAVDYTTIDMKSNIEKEAPVDEGKLQGNWHKEKLDDWVYSIFTNTEYAFWVDQGTGIYGHEQRRIYPKHGKYLSFEIDGERIFVRSIAGQKGANYTGKAEEATRARIEDFMKRAVASVA